MTGKMRGGFANKKEKKNKLESSNEIAEISRKFRCNVIAYLFRNNFSNCEKRRSSISLWITLQIKRCCS